MNANWDIGQGWFIVRQGTTVHRCPHCGEASTISLDEQYGKWFNCLWRCDYCGSTLTTKQIKEGEVN